MCLSNVYESMFVRGCVERRLFFVFCTLRCLCKSAEGTKSKTNFPSGTIKHILSYIHSEIASKLQIVELNMKKLGRKAEIVFSCKTYFNVLFPTIFLQHRSYIIFYFIRF